MKILRQLEKDGLEPLGTITLTSTVVVGDPGALVSRAAMGEGRWYGAATRPGTWHLLARPYSLDPDLLEELILVHEGTLPQLYTAYDEAVPVATLPLPHHRLVILDGKLRTDAEVLRSLVEVEEMPWVLDAGLVLSSIGEHPAQVFAPRLTEQVLLSFGLGRPPDARASADPHSSDQGAED